MANQIVQGDNGTTLTLTISDTNGIVDLRNATSVAVVILYRDKRTVKSATITDGQNGICSVVLLSSDLARTGNYALQATVTFQNGNVFSTNVSNFTVIEKI
jgi:hypothetical protein